MKNRTFRNTLLAVAVIALLGFTANAFAGWGQGCPRWNDGSPGRFSRGYGAGDMTDTEIEKYKDAQEKFLNDTEALRQEIYAKRLELRSELAKKNPDVKKAAGIQKELSRLENQFDQKKLDHQIALNKIDPAMNRGWGRGPMMGFGPRGGGYCWR